MVLNRHSSGERGAFKIIWHNNYRDGGDGDKQGDGDDSNDGDNSNGRD